jgi:diguanylate cyclase (GGDEF)-like protein
VAGDAVNPRHVGALGAFGLVCGVAVGAAGVALARQRREVARAHLLMAEAETRAHTDALTGLANRAGLYAAWPSSAPANTVLALLDLDEFKPVNDRFGHHAGDVVLVTVASRLRGLLPGALVARLGGDEFVAILPGPMDRAEVEALRVAATLALSIPIAEGITVTVTASIGLAPADTDLRAVLATADAAMYRAKTTRTGVAVFDPRRDDRTSVTADPRPAARLRTLPRSEPELLEVVR